MTATLRWAGLALLGILIAAAVSVAASRLASQQIGLDSQSISAGDALAPARKAGERPPRVSQPSHGDEANPEVVPAPPEPEPPAAPVAPAPAPAPEAGDESGGSGGGDD